MNRSEKLLTTTSCVRLGQMKAHKSIKLKRQAEYAGDGKILDVGYSANPNIFLHEPVGLDIVLAETIPENYSRVVRCNLNKEVMPFPAHSFDAVIAADVIEHLENPSSFLREVNRVLRDGGKLVICTPQANDWWTTMHNWFFRKWIKDPDSGEHLQNWTVLDMTRLLRKNGFQIEKIEGLYMHFPRIRLLIPVRCFPILSWQIFYVAKKTGLPNEKILVKIAGKKLQV